MASSLPSLWPGGWRNWLTAGLVILVNTITIVAAMGGLPGVLEALGTVAIIGATGCVTGCVWLRERSSKAPNAAASTFAKPPWPNIRNVIRGGPYTDGFV